MRTPFRLGTTSYILPDALLPNVRFLADKVRDVELLFFEVDEAQNALPNPKVFTELEALARAHDLTYTVHLPLALRLGEAGAQAEAALVRSERVIEATRFLDPFAYVAHLGSAPAPGLAEWVERAASALTRLGALAGGLDRLAVENSGETQPGIAAVLALAPASRCVDVGHLWVAGEDPIPQLVQDQSRLRLVHLHGVAQRDHQSLARVPPSELRRVLHWLLQKAFGGVVTLEVFNQDDFWSSYHAVLEVLEEPWEEV
jgi:sugar phosphate isomerase/epimerase